MGVLHHIPNTQIAINEIFRVLKPKGKVILMFYHKIQVKYRLYKVWSLFTGKSLGRKLVDEFDGIGNPKGQVYSKNELRKMMSKFIDIDMFLGFLETRDIILRGARYLPSNLFKPFEKWFGWNLYVKALKPDLMRILITGGAGCLGSNIIEHFLPLGHKILVIDNFSTGHKKTIYGIKNLKIIEGTNIEFNYFMSF